VYAKATTVNQDDSAAIIDASKVNVKVMLKRGGQQWLEIMQGNLQVLSQFSNYMRALYRHANPTATVQSLTLVAHAGGISGEYLVSYRLDFGGMINLYGEDELSCEINPIAPFGADINLNASYLGCEFRDDVGVGAFIPVTRVIQVEGTNAKFDESLGDNVSEIAFLNFDKTGVLTANRVIDSISLTSDKISFTKIYNQLIAERVAMFEDEDTAANRNQSFMLFTTGKLNPTSGEIAELDNVRLLIDLVTANNNTGKNWVVYRQVLIDPTTFNNAMELKEKHDAQTRSKIY
jgi:hypothetical protein